MAIECTATADGGVREEKGNRGPCMMHLLREAGRIARLALIPALAMTNCGSQTGIEPEFEGPHILFIGNSLTYTNDLPGMLAAMIDSAGAEPVFIQSSAFPNFGLEDHWNTGAPELIAARPWDVVVLQQGPSATEGRPSLLEFSRRFNDEVVKGGGRTALYMVWPAADRAFDFDGVSDSYRMAAEQFGGLLFPAGEAWRAGWTVDPDLALYGPDGFHPSLLGTYVAALVIFQQMTGLTPSEAPRTLTTAIDRIPVTIPGSTADVLQMAAATANDAFGRP